MNQIILIGDLKKINENDNTCIITVDGIEKGDTNDIQVRFWPSLLDEMKKHIHTCEKIAVKGFLLPKEGSYEIVCESISFVGRA